MEDFPGKTYSSLARAMSKDYPTSTVKYILAKLRKAGLITFGDGYPIKYTCLGSKVFDILGLSSNVKTSISKIENGGSTPSGPTIQRVKNESN